MNQKRLKELVRYDPLTGEFFSRRRRGLKFRHICDDGYLKIKLDGRRYRGGRLAWLYVFGEFPPSGMYIDHINRDRLDDRIGNLRLVTPSQNSLNRKKQGNRTDLPVGVSFNPRSDRPGKPYRAQITRNKVYKDLGHYATVDEAARAYMMWDKATL